MNEPGKALLYAVGRPFGPLYSQLMKLRARLYRAGIMRRYELPVPVISVGNLTMGGTGKTPLVIHLAGLLAAMGRRPAVVSRGYRGTAREAVNIVSDGRTRFLDAAAAGDEPWLIATSLPGVVVATGRRRILPCRRVIEDFGCDVIILDDGFQHLAVARTVDLVLFDAGFFAGNSRVFPGGDLREPVTALRRCDAFVITGVTAANRQRADKCRDLLERRFSGKPVIQLSAAYSDARKYIPSPTGYRIESLGLADIPTALFGFCGIARPERFRTALAEADLTTTGFRTFADHHRFTVAELTELCRQAEKTGASALLTTEKDMARLSAMPPSLLPIYTLPLKIQSDETLERLITELVV